MMASLPEGVSHSQRLSIAKSLCQMALAKHGDTIAAVGIYGSTAIGTDRPYSDLDMTFVTTVDLGDNTKCYSFKGMPIQLDYQTIEESMSEACDPVDGACWIDFLVLYDSRNIIGEFRETFRRLSADDFKYKLEALFQDHLTSLMGKVRNAVISDARAELIRSTQDFGEQVCRALLLINRASSTGNARLRAAAKALPRKPDDFDALIDIVLSARQESDALLYASTEVLWRKMSEMAQQMGIRIEMDVLQV